MTVAAITVLAIATAACAASLAGPTATLPRLRSVNAWQVGGSSDGLNRFVVQLTADSAAQTPSAAPSAASSGLTPAAGGERLDPTLLAQAKTMLGDGGHLALDSGGNTVYVVGNSSLPVGDGARSQLPPAQQKPDPAAVAIATLRAVPGVVSAQRMHDSAVLLATSLSKADVEALPGVAGVTPSVSVPVADAVSVPVATPSVSVPVAGGGAVPNDEFFGFQWHLLNTGATLYETGTKGDDVDALDAWPVTTGAGAVIADLDTGIDTTHPDLTGAFWTNPNEACGATRDTDGDGHVGDCHGWNFVENNADLDNGGNDAHGTLTGGAMVAQMNNGIGVAGLAPGARIMPLVVGAGETIDVGAAIDAIYYAVDHGANVLNCSFGGSIGGSLLTELETAVDYAQSHGVLIAVAAGNDSGNRDTSPIYPASIDNPALITVGASDANDNPASFSAYGKKSVALFAPGTHIATTDNSGWYSVASGTSLATPLVAATLALEKSADPKATMAQLRSRLLDSTKQIPALAPLSSSGGRLDAGRALGLGPNVLHYTFGGFDKATAGAPFAANVTVTGDTSGPLRLQLHLLAEYQSQTWAVSQFPITLGDTTTSTDDDGQATFDVAAADLTAGQTYSPQLTLPAGKYALTAQVIANGTPIGRPNAAIFEVPAAPSGGSTTLPPGSSGATTPPPDGSSTSSPPDGSTTTPPPPTGSTTTPPPDNTGASSPPPTSGTTTPPPDSSATTPPSEDAGATTPPPDDSPTTPPGNTGATSPPPTSGTTTPPPTSGATTPPATSPPPTSGSTTPPATSGATAAPSTSPPATSPPATSPPPTSGTTTPAPTNPPPTSPPPTSGATTPPPTSGSGGSTPRQYPGTDQFEITGLSPTVLPMSGGVVTLSGNALPLEISVLVGGTPVTVLQGNSTTTAMFIAPSMLAGSYDVAVWEVGGLSPTTLSGALTYQDSATGNPPSDNTGGGGAPSPTSGATSPPPDNTGATTPPPTSGATSPPSDNTGATTPPPTSGTTSPPPTSGATSPPPDNTGATSPPPSSPASTPVVITTADGLRLVRSDAVSSFTRLLDWSTPLCAASCNGTPL